MKIETRNGKCLLVALLLWLACAPLAQAFYNPSTGRWLSRDPIEEADDSNVYVFVHNDSGNRIDKDGRVMFVPPMPSNCSDPCGKAKRMGIDKGDAGGIICCNGVVYSCVWDAGGASGATSKKGREIVSKCALNHEKDHAKKEWCSSCGFYRPKPWPWKRKAMECDAYRVELQCLNDSLADCGDDRACRADVKSEINSVKDSIKEFCGAQ